MQSFTPTSVNSVNTPTQATTAGAWLAQRINTAKLMSSREEQTVQTATTAPQIRRISILTGAPVKILTAISAILVITVIIVRHPQSTSAVRAPTCQDLVPRLSMTAFSAPLDITALALAWTLLPSAQMVALVPPVRVLHWHRPLAPRAIIVPSIQEILPIRSPTQHTLTLRDMAMLSSVHLVTIKMQLHSQPTHKSVKHAQQDLNAQLANSRRLRLAMPVIIVKQVIRGQDCATRAKSPPILLVRQAMTIARSQVSHTG